MICILRTSKGVSGHFPWIRLRPGKMTRPFCLNFNLHPFSLIEFISIFSASPPSYKQHEKATMSYSTRETIKKRLNFVNLLTQEWNTFSQKWCVISIITSSNRRWTETYFPPVIELFSIIRLASFFARVETGEENLSAS